MASELVRDGAVAPAAENSLPTIGWGEEIKCTLSLAWPLIIAQLAQMALFTTDAIMMGWLGAKFLASGTLAATFMHPFLLFGVGTISAVAPMIAQAIGRKDFRSVRRSIRQGFWASIVVGAVLLAIVWQARTIFGYLGQSEGNGLLAEGYIHLAAWSFFPGFMTLVLRCFLSAYNKTQVVLMITLLGVVLNALGNYALMFGNWGFPRLELVGAGISTTVVSTVMFLVMLGYVLTHRKFKRYAILVRLWKPDWTRFVEIFRIGTPIGLMILSESGLFTAATMLMGWLGTDQLAAHAVALQCASIAFMVPLGMSQATTIRVGIAYGQGSNDKIGKAGWVSIAMGTGVMGATALAFLLIPEVLVAIYLDPAVPANQIPLQLAVSFLAVAALFQLVDGAQVVAAAALRGLSDTTVPMVMAVVGYWLVGFPVSYLCGFVLDWGGQGIWLGLAAGLAFAAVVLTIRFAFRARLGLLKARRD